MGVISNKCGFTPFDILAFFGPLSLPLFWPSRMSSTLNPKPDFGVEPYFSVQRRRPPAGDVEKKDADNPQVGAKCFVLRPPPISCPSFFVVVIDILEGQRRRGPKQGKMSYG